MDRITEQRIATLILRIVGVITIFISFITISSIVISYFATSLTMSNMPGGDNVDLKTILSNFNIWAVFAQLVITIWGFLFYCIAEHLAKVIVSD